MSQNVSGLNYVQRGADYNIHMCAKLYYLGRAKVFLATDFGPSTIKVVIITDLEQKQKSAQNAENTIDLPETLQEPSLGCLAS